MQILLDWDGTVVDNHKSHSAALVASLTELGLPIPTSPTLESLRYKTLNEVISDIGIDDQLVSTVIELKRIRYSESKLKAKCVSIGLVQALRSLAQREEIRVAIFSNGSFDRVRSEARDLNLGFVSEIFGNESIQTTKPSNAAFCEVAEVLGVRHAEILVIDDNVECILAAADLKMNYLLVTESELNAPETNRLKQFHGMDITSIIDRSASTLAWTKMLEKKIEQSSRIFEC